MTQPAPRLQSWAESWWRAIADLGRATHERREVVLQEVQVGSVPTLTYYALLGISELIAGFALIIDSDATLIGANIGKPSVSGELPPEIAPSGPNRALSTPPLSVVPPV